MRAAVCLAASLVAAPLRAEPPPRSPGMATALAVGGTLAGATMFTLGLRQEGGWLTLAGVGALTFLPSMGHWYAGEGDTRGIGLRLGGMLCGATALLVWLDATDPFDNSPDRDDTPSTTAELAIYLLAGAGTGLFLHGLSHDWTDAGEAARRHNLQLAAMLGPDVAGLGLGGSF